MSCDSQELNFFALFSRIPLVNSALIIGSNLYDNLKKCSPYAETTLLTTEQIIVYIANTHSVTKMTQTLEKPMVYVNSFACDRLQALESKYPSITMAPEEFKEELVNQMLVLKGLGVKKLDQLMHDICHKRRVGMAKALVFLEDLLDNRAAVYVDFIDKTVDEYLPPLEEYETDGQIVRTDGSPKIFERLAVIPLRVQERLSQRYNQFLLRITWKEEQSIEQKICFH